MGQRLRIQHPDTIYLITGRCKDAKFLMRPDPRVNALILACLCRASAIHGIDVMGYVFMGNHFHLIVRAPRCNLSKFMKDMGSWLAIKLRRHWGIEPNERYAIFSGRFSCIDLLDDATAFDKLIYILANPCAAYLVDKPEEYPGLSSLQQHRTGEVLKGRWIDQEKLTHNRRKNPSYDEEKAAEYHELRLVPLPQFEGLSQDEIARRITDALMQRVAQIRKERGRKPVVGRRRLQKIHHEAAPRKPKVTPCPYCMSIDPEKKAQHKAFRERTTVAYYQAKKRRRKAGQTTPWDGYPPGTTPPGTAKCVPYQSRDLERCGLILEYGTG